MKEETLNALDEFLRQVMKFADCTASVNPELKPMATELKNAATDLREMLPQEALS